MNAPKTSSASFRRSALSLAFASALGLVVAQSACEKYVAPPEVSVQGAKDGVLTDSKAPLVLSFSKPIRPETLDIKILPLDLDIEGNLPDERGVPDAELKPLFSWTQVDRTSPDIVGGSAELSGDDSALIVTPNAPFPVGQKLVAVVEAGLSTKDGVVTTVRKRILFSYDFRCSGTRGSKIVSSGSYFALLDIEEPVPVQIQLWAKFEVDPATGNVRAQFTNADRKPGQSCPTDCGTEKVCRLLPNPECVVPSLKAGGVDEFPDFVPNATPPTGYTLTVNGCIEDQDATSAAFVSAPANLVVQKPEVQVNGLILTASFKKDSAGVLRSTGTVTGSEIVFGSSRLKSGRGTANIRSISPELAPADIPAPPPAPVTGDF